MLRRVTVVAAFTLLACQPRWEKANTARLEGWTLQVPDAYAPVLKNEALLRRISPELGAQLDTPQGQQQFATTWVLTAGPACAVHLTHVSAPDACRRAADYRATRGPSQSLTLANGTWVQQATVSPEGGTITSWDHCEPDADPQGPLARGYDELFSVLSSNMPSCLNTARQHEAVLLQAIATSKLH